MTNAIVPIVEGHAEVTSVPIIMRRLLEKFSAYDLEIAKPVRAKRYQIVKPGELERTVKLAMTRRDCRAIMVVLDADDDCPKDLAPSLLQRAQAVAQNIVVSVVLARSEMESWFLASLESLRGIRGVSCDACSLDNVEDIRDAKSRLSRFIEPDKHYIEAIYQPAFCAKFDFDSAISKCRSFQKFYKDFRNMTSVLYPSE